MDGVLSDSWPTGSIPSLLPQAMSQRSGRYMQFVVNFLGGYKWPDGMVQRTLTNTNAMMVKPDDRMPVILEPQHWPW